VKILLEVADADGNVLCLAAHDRVPPAAKLMRAIGSTVIERARHPLVVVGPNASAQPSGSDVVVGVDGVGDPEPLLTEAAEWARTLHSRLRIVTVYEPVPVDLREPEHFNRRHGPPSDPDLYLSALRQRVAEVGLDVSTVAIADPVSVGAGLEQHLVHAPARLLVVGGGHHRPGPSGGIARHVLTSATVPLLMVNRFRQSGDTAGSSNR
jgi:nucleotide-binding universal stress UspA family protein